MTIIDSVSGRNFTITQAGRLDVETSIQLPIGQSFKLNLERPKTHLSCVATPSEGLVSANTVINVQCSHICTLDYSNIAKIEYANPFQEEMQKQMAKGSSGTESWTAIGAYASITDKSYGSVLAKNGIIYDMPFHVPTMSNLIQKLNTLTEANSTIVGAINILRGFHGGILAPNGNIYFTPYEHTDIQIFNPNTETNVGNIPVSAGVGTSYVGGTYSPNTNQVYIPRNPSGLPLRKINMSNNSVSSLSNVTSLYYGCSLALNGMIYCANLSATCNATCEILKINPTNDTLTYLILPSPTGSFIGTTLAPNGLIYLLPYDSTKIYTINPSNDAVTEVISGVTGLNKWASGVLAPNGKIYLTPEGASNVGIIDTSNNTINTTTLIGIDNISVGINTLKFAGAGKIGANGKIYISPRNANKALAIDTKSNGSFCESIRLSPNFNKF